MGEGKFAADFVSANLDKIISIGKQAIGKIDAQIQLKLKTAYTEFLNNTRLKYSKSKSFFIRSQPVELYSYYVPTGIACGNKIIKTPNFKNCTEFTKRILITGTGGSGKSVLIKHLLLDCISNKEFVPILIELRDLNSQDRTIDYFIDDTLSTFGFSLSKEYIEKAKEYGHFSFFLDGFDELNPKLREKTRKEILALAKKFPKCPIFLSSRPDDRLSGIEDFSVFAMRCLELDEALSLVSRLPFDEAIKKKFSEDLSNGLFIKHKSFLSNPLLLSIMLLTYEENAEIPSKLSIFYNQAYEALFHKHDANKGGYSRKRLTRLDIQDFSKVFSLFCLQTYEKRLMKMSSTQCLEFIKKGLDNLNIEIKPEDFLQDLMSAACLLIEDGFEIAFSHRSFQEYFVAIQISNSPPEIQKKLIDRYCINMHIDSVMHLLREINPDLIERELFIPKLEKFFEAIGVVKKVGITHHLKCIKYFFDAIIIEEKRIFFAFKVGAGMNGTIILNEILNTVALCYSDLKLKKTEKNMDQIYEEFSRVYGKGGKRIAYKTKELTIRSPLIKDLIKAELTQIEYFASAPEAFKRLKSKHANAAQNFEALLGIK